MSTDHSPRLSTWLRDRETETEIRIAVRDDDGWIDRSQLTKNVETFEIELRSDPIKRYKLTIDRLTDELQLERRTRLAFRVLGVNEDQKLQRDNVTILLEIPGLDPTEIPEYGEATLTLPSSFLEYVDSSRDEHENYRPATIDRVAGLETEKHRLTRFLETGNREWGLSEPTGVILEGPPGTGKTELVMEVCQEKYGKLPITISGPEVLSKWVGETEQHLRSKFEETLETTHRVLYIDELDAIARTRTEASQDYVAQLVSQLLVLLDGIDAKVTERNERPLRVVASTNIAQVVDPALRRPGRLGNRPIQVGLPSEKARAAILHHYLENIYASPDGQLGPTLETNVTTAGNLVAIRRLAAEIEGFSGAEIEDVVQEAVSRTRARESNQLTLDIFKEVMRTAFSKRDNYRTRELAVDHSEVSYDDLPPVDQQVIELPMKEADEQRAERIAKQYFSRLDSTAQNNIQYVFRIVDPGYLLDGTRQQTREQTATVFQHIESERLCVYLKNIETLERALPYSSSVQTVIEVLNEQLLQWHDENVLLVDATPEMSSLLYCLEGSRADE